MRETRLVPRQGFAAGVTSQKLIHNNAARRVADLLNAPAARTNPNHKAGRNVIAGRLRDGGIHRERRDEHCGWY